MNAYELADYIKENYATNNNDIDKVANMLRQQADRIAELEKENEELSILCVEFNVDVKKQSEPVAWIPKGMTLAKPKDLTDCIPLYTTPHHASDVKQTKPLSEEEIKEVIRKHWNKEYGNRNMLTLCKAVLKEANK